MQTRSIEILEILEIQADSNRARLQKSHEKCNYLWSASANKSRIQADVTNVMSIRQPTDESLQSETVSSVWNTSVLSLIHIPEIVLRIDSGSFERGEHLRFLPDTHRSTDDLADSWHQKIHGFCQFFVVGTTWHVECLDSGREAVEENWLK
ncbi:hypothetical protein GCK72_000249 [Caenorhabditis remanei]|uniref:Uncharacterized protein n=1 Tax=Caenorhabditis remanei TaxID=31234 RepID=A0A6A5HQ52_CAERE|nr:hypothetical protein GCK72_000249 [Caenorhabditis remanei]KAF1768437.1 hypothetical protein GCK72_000249 [Caenorhabditis remanei]